MRKTWMVLVFGLALSLMMAGAAQAATIYTNYAGFLVAFPSPTVENFEDTTLEPGLSVVSTYSGAIIEDGVYKDIVGGGFDYTTTWIHSGGFTAFGGWFDLTPGGEGTNIQVDAYNPNTSTWESIGEIDRSFAGQFWGFSTGYVFNQVLFSEGSYPANQETYWNVDLAYKAVPEPSTLLLLGSGLLGICTYARKRK